MKQMIAVDLAEVADARTGRHLLTLAWGDEIEVRGETETHVEVRVTRFEPQGDGSLLPVEVDGRIRKPAGVDVVKAPRDVRVLKVDFVDVQQGDGVLMQTPGGKVVLIDGGENQLFARYLAGRFQGTRRDRPKVVDAIVVSHGDADHFKGLPEIAASETIADRPHKRIFIKPLHVFHNGLVKRTGGRGVRDVELFGRTVPADPRPLIVDLRRDLLEVPDEEMNDDFVDWKRTLEHWRDTQGPIEVDRLELGDDEKLDFLAERRLSFEVLGPITVDGGLPFLGEPIKRFGHPETAPRRYERAPSASHTVNGHSIVLRVTYGRWRLLFAGDLNEEAEDKLVALEGARRLRLRSEVLKVPHHGSADFHHDFLASVAPLVSVVSAGDDKREHIHPRATLMTGLGRHSRGNDPVLFVTELVAFFRSRGWVQPAAKEHADDRVASGPSFFGFSREAYGTVRVRTDGTRLLVYTDAGEPQKKEAYAWELDDETGDGLPQKLSWIRRGRSSD